MSRATENAIFNIHAVGRSLNKSKVRFAIALLNTFDVGKFEIFDGIPCIKLHNKYTTIIIEYDWVANVLYVSKPHESKSYKLNPMQRSDLAKLHGLLTWFKLAERDFLGKGYYGWETILS